MIENNKSVELSIIIPYYNGAKYIDDCINSILAQTFKNYEIIICDDCSTDNSTEIIQQYVFKYPFIRAIYHQKNIGIPINRNSGILMAKGLYVTTIDQDDVYYDIQKLEKEMNIVKYYKEKERKIVCAFSKIAILNKELNYVKDQWPENKILEGSIFKEIISRSAMIPRDYIVAKEAYKKVGLYDKLDLYEDWDLKIRLSHKYHFYFTGIYGTGYVRHGHGESNVPIPQNINGLKKVFNKNFYLASGVDKVEIIQKFSRFLNSMTDIIINQLNKQLDNKSNQIKQQKEKLKNKNTLLSQKNIKIKDLYEEIANKNKLLSKKNNLIKQQDEQLTLINNSNTYKIVKLILWPLRKINSALIWK